MENRRRFVICNIDIHGATFDKHLGSKEHLEINYTRRVILKRSRGKIPY